MLARQHYSPPDTFGIQNLSVMDMNSSSYLLLKFDTLLPKQSDDRISSSPLFGFSTRHFLYHGLQLGRLQVTTLLDYSLFRIHLVTFYPFKSSSLRMLRFFCHLRARLVVYHVNVRKSEVRHRHLIGRSPINPYENRY